jgi:hypothetical protein
MNQQENQLSALWQAVLYYYLDTPGIRVPVFGVNIGTRIEGQ